MQIQFQKNLVEFAPETAEERAKLEALWRLCIDCNGPAVRLAPVGEFVPGRSTGATFTFEGRETPAVPTVRASEDCVVYCRKCNRRENLHRGDAIPPCCGRLMEIVD